nr:hypothetical protein Iba_chr04aCG6480 [Ipomoea batatas]
MDSRQKSVHAMILEGVEEDISEGKSIVVLQVRSLPHRNREQDQYGLLLKVSPVANPSILVGRKHIRYGNSHFRVHGLKT